MKKAIQLSGWKVANHFYYLIFFYDLFKVLKKDLNYYIEWMNEKIDAVQLTWYNFIIIFNSFWHFFFFILTFSNKIYKLALLLLCYYVMSFQVLPIALPFDPHTSKGRVGTLQRWDDDDDGE